VVKPSSNPSDSGSALILVLLITALLTTIAVSFLSTSRVEQIAAKNFSRQNAASGLAELATQQAMADIQKGFNSATTNATALSFLLTQPGRIMNITFPGGSITPTELFPTAASVSGNTTLSSATIDLNQIASNNTANTTITGNKTESIQVPLAEFTQGNLTCRYTYYVDDDGTKLNLNTATNTRSFINITPTTARQTMISAISGAQASNFGNIIDGAGSSTSNLTNWAFFFRPEQAKGTGIGINATTDIPNITTAVPSTLSVNSSATANTTFGNNTSSTLFSHTPWGTERLFINTLSTNAIDGTGAASVNTIHAALTNSTLTRIFGSNFENKYTSAGVKQIAANMLQMRDPNTSSANASFSYNGPLLGSNGTSIPNEYLGYAPYPVITEVGVSVQIGSMENVVDWPYRLMLFFCPTIELSNPYSQDFINSSGAELDFGSSSTQDKFIIKEVSFDLNYDSNTTKRYTWSSSCATDTTIKAPFGVGNAEQFPKAGGYKIPNIPKNSKIQYQPDWNHWWSPGLPISCGPNSGPAITINSVSNVTVTISAVKVMVNGNIRDWVSGGETGPLDCYVENYTTLPLKTGAWPRRVYPPTCRVGNFTDSSSQRIDWFRKTTANATSNLSSNDERRNWTTTNSSGRGGGASGNASTGFPDGLWTESQSTWIAPSSNKSFLQATETNPLLYNSTKAKPSLSKDVPIPSDPALNDSPANAVYPGNSTTDMREPILATGSYTCPADLGLVPTNQRWRRLRMQPQPASESTAGLIPDWAMLDIISFGTNATKSNFVPVNLNGKFHVPSGSPQPTGRDLGIRSLTKAIDSFSASGNVTIQDIFSNNSTTIDATKFLGANSGNSSSNDIAQNIANMKWSSNSSWSARRTTLNFPSNIYLLPSEIIEIQDVADTIPLVYSGGGEHFKRNEGKISALLPGFTTRSNFFTIYAYGEVGKYVNGSFQEDSRFYTKTLVEVQGTPGNYKVTKLYTQPIPLGQ
jgi:Tfp pilus assembly protein PilX